MTHRVRLPPPHLLGAEPPLGLLLALQLVAQLAATSLRAWHPAVEGDPYPDEDPEVVSARALLHLCRGIHGPIADYHRQVRARIRQEDTRWPF